MSPSTSAEDKAKFEYNLEIIEGLGKLNFFDARSSISNVRLSLSQPPFLSNQEKERLNRALFLYSTKINRLRKGYEADELLTGIRESLDALLNMLQV